MTRGVHRDQGGVALPHDVAVGEDPVDLEPVAGVERRPPRLRCAPRGSVPPASGRRGCGSGRSTGCGPRRPRPARRRGPRRRDRGRPRRRRRCRPGSSWCRAPSWARGWARSGGGRPAAPGRARPATTSPTIASGIAGMAAPSGDDGRHLRRGRRRPPRGRCSRRRSRSALLSSAVGQVPRARSPWYPRSNSGSPGITIRTPPSSRITRGWTVGTSTISAAASSASARGRRSGQRPQRRDRRRQHGEVTGPMPVEGVLGADPQVGDRPPGRRAPGSAPGGRRPGRSGCRSGGARPPG